MTRQDDHERVSSLAGVDADGGILPPGHGFRINRDAKFFWSVMKMIDDLTAAAGSKTAWRLRAYRAQYMAECLAHAEGRPYSPWAPGDHHSTPLNREPS